MHPRFQLPSLHEFHWVMKCILPGVETSRPSPGPRLGSPWEGTQLGSSWPSLGTAVSVPGPSDVASRGTHLCWHLLAGRLSQVFPASWLIPVPFGWVTPLVLGCLHCVLEHTVSRMASLAVTQLGLSHPPVTCADFWRLTTLQEAWCSPEGVGEIPQELAGASRLDLSDEACKMQFSPHCCYPSHPGSLGLPFPLCLLWGGEWSFPALH